MRRADSTFRHFGERNRQSRRSGFSFVECAISLLFTSVVILGALNAVSSTHRARTTIQSQRLATELAQSLMTEIMRASYSDPGVIGGGASMFGMDSGEWTGDRSQFDDVDDYAMVIESPPKDKNGAALALYSGWTRRAWVCWVDPANPSGPPILSETGLKCITVSVTDPNSKTTSMVAFRARQGLGEQKPVATTTFVTEANVDITVGASNTKLSTGVNLANGAN